MIDKRASEIYRGGCHCGAIAFDVEAPPRIECHQCNCSICRLTGYLHLIVPKTKFTLLRGQDSLSSYRFNSGVAEHLFCTNCGIKSFYVPRSNPDGYSINVRCLSPQPRDLTIIPFDGVHWEEHAKELAALSQ